MPIPNTNDFSCDPLFDNSVFDDCGNGCQIDNTCLCRAMHDPTTSTAGVAFGGNRKLKAIIAATTVQPNSHTAEGEVESLLAGDHKIIERGSYQLNMAACVDPTTNNDEHDCTPFPNQYDSEQAMSHRVCSWSVINGATSHSIKCATDSGGSPNNDDLPVILSPHLSSFRQVEILGGRCLPYHNVHCWGHAFLHPVGGVVRGYVNTLWHVFNNIGITYHGLSINTANRPYQDKVAAYLQNRGLAMIPFDTGPGGAGMDIVTNENGANWQLETWDRWLGGRQYLATGDCATAPVVDNLVFRTAVSGCTVNAELVAVATEVRMNMSIHYAGDDSFTVPGVIKGVFPTIVFRVDLEYRLRLTMPSPCTFEVGDIPWGEHAAGETITIELANPDCGIYVESGGLNINGERLELVSVESQAFSEYDLEKAIIPHTATWYGFHGASALSRSAWESIHAGDDVSFIARYCCCLVEGLHELDVHPYQTAPHGADGDQVWGGHITLHTTDAGGAFPDCLPITPPCGELDTNG